MSAELVPLRGVIDARGKTLVLRVPQEAVVDEATRQQLANLARQAREETGAAAVLVVPEGWRVETLDEEQMRAAGWVRASEAP